MFRIRFLKPLLAVAFVLVCGLAGLAPSSSFASGTPYPAGSHGYDISWPQCPSNFPTPDQFAIVGVNDGKANTTNPCFAQEIAWARKAPAVPSVYLNTNGPARNFVAAGCSRKDANCNSYQYGVQAANYALSAASASAGDVVNYWLDVETANVWSTNTSANAQVVKGMVDTLRSAGKNVGIYSTSYQYGKITGNYQFPGVALWIPAASGADPAGSCTSLATFAGGFTAMVQWTNTWDEDYACP